MSTAVDRGRPAAPSLAAVLGDEAFRLFFPLAAVHAALWPFLWVVVYGIDLPLARTVPPQIWHVHEMVIGAYGAALIGFIGTAVPEWTDTPHLNGRPLYALAAAWCIGRAVGLVGADGLAPVGALADLAWLAALVVYVCRVSVRKRTTRILGFAAWLAALWAAEAATRYGMLSGDIALAQRMAHGAGLVFLGLLGLALARITVPVSNLVLDPSEATSPFRPHPGRRNLAPGLVAVAIAGELAGLSVPATGFLMVAAGAAFLDRMADAFIGREAMRSEILALSAAGALAGVGLLMIGVARLGAALPEVAGLHVALMGGLGLGVLAVFSIAGLLHTGQALRFARRAKLALVCVGVSVVMRVLPDLGFGPVFPGPTHGLAALTWASGFLLWLSAYWPLLSGAQTLGARRC